MKNINSSLLVFLLLIFTSYLNAQPANDECATAISIPVTSACTSANYNTIGATNSPLSNPSCGNYQGADVWFKLIVPASGKVQIRVQGLSGMIANWAVYTGLCGALTELKCSANYPSYNINDLALGGQTLSIRVWRQASIVGGTFSICAWEPNTPINDFCANAINLPVNNICTPITYSSVGCTAEPASVATNPPCGFYTGGDIWFKVIVPNSGHLRIEKENVSGIVAHSAIYSGACGSFTLIECLNSNEPFNLNNSSMAGQTLYVRVWNYAQAFEGGSFKLCAWETTPPLNDDCADATLLPLNTSCTFSTYSSVSSTTQASSVAAIPPCGFYEGGDVWFKVIVPSSGKLRIEKQNLSGISAQSAIYSGTCGAFTLLKCLLNNEPYNINSLSQAGQTLYIRVWNYAQQYEGGTFRLCAWETNPPINDFCANAIPLAVNSNCSPTSFNNIGCTSEAVSISPNPSCGFYKGSDVWFTITVPSSGHLRIETNNLVGVSAQSALYSGTCGNMTQLGCWGVNSGFNINNVSFAAQQLYLRVFTYGEEFTGGTFQVCAWEPDVPLNDFCLNAIPLTVGSSCQLDTFSNVGCTSEPTAIAAIPTCGFYQGSDVWFTIVVPASGHLRIERNNIIGQPNMSYAIYTGTCGNMIQIGCVQSSNYFNLHNHALAGQTLLLRVFTYGDQFNGGQFAICAWEPLTPENDFCANAIPLSVGLTCTYTNYSNIGCTSQATSIAPNPSCGFYTGGDVWFTFVMPLSGLATIQRVNLSSVDHQLSVFTGSCGAMTQLACVQSNGTLVINNPSLVGQTLYLRIFSYGSGDGGPFQLCIIDPTCLVTIDSVQSIPTTCSNLSNGSLNIVAHCDLCVGNLEYSLNNGPFQSSPVFNNLAYAVYSVKVRDSGQPFCFQTLANPVIVSYQQLAQTYFEDLDGDNYGKSTPMIVICGAPPANYVAFTGDCNDANNLIHPGAQEIVCNNIDENCNGQFDDKPVEIDVQGNCQSISDGNLIVGANDGNATQFGDISINTSKTNLFTIRNTGMANLNIAQVLVSGPDAPLFTIGALTPGNVIGPNQEASFGITFTPTTLGIKNAIITILNNDCNESTYDFAIQGMGTLNNFALLDLKLFIEGYYIGAGMMTTTLLNQGLVTCPSITDSIDVELRHPSNYSIVAATTSLLQTNGNINCRFPNVSGNYYIVVKHRSGIQTWSAQPVNISNTLTYYNFSDVAGKAYGSNQREMTSGIFAIYSGDINEDENIDLGDFTVMENDINDFQYGYRSADINGDGNVDLGDIPNLESNINLFIFSDHP